MIGPFDDVVLDVRDLRTHLHTRRGIGKAVEGVSFILRRGRTLGLVGESGSGKSMAAMSLLQLHPQPAARIVGGQVLFDGVDLLRKSQREMRAYRGRHIAYVPQDPLSSLNPVFRIGDQLAEPLRLHLSMSGPSLQVRLIELLRKVNIPSPAARLLAFPHQLSGGTRQRVVSAMGISCGPEVLIADEPTTALDVTVQAEYLELLRDIQLETGLAILFITHDFGIVANLCDDVLVMYAGRIVEQSPTPRLFAQPAHPYTRALLASLPDPTSRVDRLAAIPGQPPSIFEAEVGCPFAPRCANVMARCTAEDPPFL
ncbi:MAG: ABC transporter ATP-binding protein, partial [Burkholderiales bacterium]